MKTENTNNGVMTVASLRQKGFKVNIMHLRRVKGQPNLLIQRWQTSDSSMIEPKGGQTEAFIVTPDNVKVKGEAVCSPKDAYCRKAGISLALARAFVNLKDTL